MRTLLVFLGAVLLAGPVKAQDRPALRFDPNRIEFATPWAQSSPCLADRTDPLCTIQAIVVCATFSTRPECSDFPRQHKYSNPNRYNLVEFRVVQAALATPSDIRAFDRATDNARLDPDTIYDFVRPGILQARILDRACRTTGPDCDDAPWRELIVTVTRRGSRWGFAMESLFVDDLWIVESGR